MRLVWVVIPILLIGIVGVQESFATSPTALISSTSLSNIPKLGETAQLTITTDIFTRSYAYPIHTISILLPSGFELVEPGDFVFDEKSTEIFQNNKGYENYKIFGNEVSVSDSVEIQTITSVVTIKAVQTGNWTLNASVSSLNVAVGEEESFLVDSFVSNISSQDPLPEPPILLYSSKVNYDSVDETFAPGVLIPYDQKIILSKIPKRGETATISVIINLKPEFSQLQGNSTQKITLENGFSFVNIDESLLTLNPKTNLLSYSESLPVVMNVPTVFEFEITPTKVGVWSVHVDGGNYKHRPSFDFIVNDNETILDEKSSYKSGLVVENVTSKISSGLNLQEKLASVPICENTSVKFPNSALTSEQKILKSFYQSDLVVTGQVINKTTYTSNEKDWNIIHVEIQDILNPHPNFVIDADNSIVLVSTKCWSYSDNLENEWSFDVEDNVFLYLNRIHDIRFTISNPIKDTSIDTNVMSIPSPFSQNHGIKNGIWGGDWDDIYCKPSLVSITKPNTEFACVKPSTVEKLIQRGWTDTLIENKSDIFSESMTIKTGWFGGFCFGYCTGDVELTSEKILFHSIPRVSNESLCSEVYEEIAFTKQEFHSLFKLVDLEKFNALPDVIKSSSTTVDLGASWIEISDGNNTKKIIFTLINDIPEIQEFATELAGIEKSLRSQYLSSCSN